MTTSSTIRYRLTCAAIAATAALFIRGAGVYPTQEVGHVDDGGVETVVVQRTVVRGVVGAAVSLATALACAVALWR